MEYVFPPRPQPALPIEGTAQLFPIHRVYCVGRNYADHAREMGADPDREPPFFFQKNADSVTAEGRVPYPAETSAFHHELELVVALGPDAGVFGYAVGLDMTRRDLQNDAKKAGRPWEVAKAFDRSAPCSAIVPAARSGHPSRGALRLEVNGALRQEGDLSEMIWDVPAILRFLARYFELVPGDLIFTGTPKGVGPVVRGDQLHGTIEGIGALDVIVV